MPFGSEKRITTKDSSAEGISLATNGFDASWCCLQRVDLAPDLCPFWTFQMLFWTFYYYNRYKNISNYSVKNEGNSFNISGYAIFDNAIEKDKFLNEWSSKINSYNVDLDENN
mgnify:CR=1 FL=1